MQNDPPPIKYSQYLALHARVMVLFGTLKEVFHHVGFNNFYNSAAFWQASFNHPLNPLVHGVTQKEDVTDIPFCVQQQEEKNRKVVDSVQGTVKVTKLEGDPGCPFLIVSSVYDTKPVHYLSMISNKVKWIVKERLVGI